MDSDLIQQITCKNQFLYEDVRRKIIGLSFDVMNEFGEHKAQVINYLAVSGMLVGLIINFGQAKAQTTRLEHPGYKVPSKIPSCISCSS